MPCRVNICKCYMIKRYTTPTCIFELDIEPDLIKDCRILFGQFEKVLFSKSLEDCEIDNATKTLAVPLNEFETSKLNCRLLLHTQIRVEFIDGTLDNSNIMKINVEDVLGGKDMYATFNPVNEVTTTDHNKLLNRDLANQHPIEAISGLREELDKKNVYNYETHYDFPSVGKVDVLYKAQKERLVYQWNPDELKYESLGDESSMDLSDVKIINGGNANGYNEQ